MTQHLVEAGVFRPLPVQVLDGGARGGANSQWDAYADQVQLFAFEPDEEECRRLNEKQASRNGAGITYYPVAVSGEKGRGALHVANFPDSSSMLPTNHELMDRFAMAEYLTQVRSVEVETTDVDSFVHDHDLQYLDFIKLDVEGKELASLEGASTVLGRSLLGIELEVWFQPEHVGRPLFADIDAYLRRHGYALFDLRDLVRWRRKTLCGTEYKDWAGSGQLMYANALYFLDLPGQVAAGRYETTPQSLVQVLKLASLAELSGYRDFAIEVIRGGEQAGVLKAEDAAVLSRLLEKGVGAQAAWLRPIRAAARAAVPLPLRIRLRAAVQALVAD